MRGLALALVLSAAGFSQAQAQPGAAAVKRTQITQQAIPPKTVATVTVTRLDFLPGQLTGRHQHPVPVIGYVLEGEFVVKVEGQAERHYTAGQSIYEPADTTIERFDNASTRQPAVLIATYLAGAGQTELIRLLPAR